MGRFDLDFTRTNEHQRIAPYPTIQRKNPCVEVDPVAVPLDILRVLFDQTGLNLRKHTSHVRPGISFNRKRNEANVSHGIEICRDKFETYRVRLNDTLASTSISAMNTSRNAMSPRTAEKSAPLKRIDLIALTE